MNGKILAAVGLLLCSIMAFAVSVLVGGGGLMWYFSKKKKETDPKKPNTNDDDKKNPANPTNKPPTTLGTVTQTPGPGSTTTPPPTTADNYDFYKGKDSESANQDIKQLSDLKDKVDQIRQACDGEKDCVAFNTNGVLKKALQPKSSWQTWTSDATKGLYVKKTYTIPSSPPDPGPPGPNNPPSPPSPPPPSRPKVGYKTNVAPVGGSGGTKDIDVMCDNPHFIERMKFWVKSGHAITFIEAWCSDGKTKLEVGNLDVNSEDFDTEGEPIPFPDGFREVKVATDGQVIKGITVSGNVIESANNLQTLDCGANHLVMGFVGKAGAYIDKLGLKCGNLIT
jgi:hypothetical protein